MGVRFRKSVKMGPVRVNFSKSGVGYSVGGKGFRVTKKATGGVRTTASIPGTGISHVEDYGGSKRRPTTGRGVEYAAREINPVVDLCLCLFLGYFGAHIFYRGKTGMGIVYVFTFGLFGIGWIYDSIQCIIRVCKKEKTPGS